MKVLNNLNKYRNRKAERILFSGFPSYRCGVFEIPLKSGVTVKVIMDNGINEEEWEHVSVSLKDRCPTWEEMCEVKDLFFEEDETVVQFHPPKKDYVNIYPYCLHLWRYKPDDFPAPKPSSVI